ncbi:GIY-YIG nuclease family protein [Streptomyces sp. NPDC060243]|uniref:GIY-YIG nuclease family protein n=1 Tax=Streptomyces sp. NPDC060243 TaxID=3347081 RepID=UPI003658CEFF
MIDPSREHAHPDSGHMAMVFAAEGISGPEKALLLALTSFTNPHGYCWPSEELLADMTGTSVRTVRRSRAKLAAMALVKSVRQVDKATGNPITNLTRVNLPLLASMKRSNRDEDDTPVLIAFEEEAEPHRAPSEWAYAICDATATQVKIGRTRNVERRLQSLQTSHPATLRVLWRGQGGGELEAHLHARFASRRIRGEWFDFAGVNAMELITKAAKSFAVKEGA